MRLFFLFGLLFTLSANAQNSMYDICPLKVGDSIPVVRIVDNNGTSFSLRELTKKPSVIVFYRGAWCPYCTRHLSAIMDAYPTIDSLGYELIAITPDQPDSLETTIKRTDWKVALYSDSKAEAINAFGLGWTIEDKTYIKYRDKYGIDTEKWSGEKHHQLPVPAVYIVKDGVVQYQYVNPNYSVRLSPSVLTALLRAL